LTVPYFTLTNITFGVVGAIFGTFPSVYDRTVGRMSKRRKAEAIFSKLLKEPLTDRRLIKEFLEGIDNKEQKEISKLEAMGGLMFDSPTKSITEWIMAYDANGKILGRLDTKEVSNLFRSNSDRNRNRVAFGFIAMGYSVQIFGLLLGAT
jgi:ribosomal protein L13